jgi:hypothetical protein
MSGARRLLLSGIALTVLLAVVALASHAHRPGGGAGGGTAETPRLIVAYVLSAMFVLFPFGVLAVLWMASLGRREKLLKSSGSVASQFRTIFTFALIAIPVAYLFRHYVHVHPTRAGRGAGSGSGNIKLDPGHAATGQFQWLPALIVGSLLFVVAASLVAAIIWKRMRGDDWEREAELFVALDEVLADTLDDLRGEQDPRRAVIRAFARMEQTFAAHDVARDPSETPRQYVERALDRLGISGTSVRQLTKLYERAKFSRLEVDESMKGDAIDALAGLRAELESDQRAAA